MAMQATGPVDKAAAENQLTGALKSLFAVAENYPQLQASQEFTQLQNSLSEIEDAIQNARRYYNAVVRDLNTKIQSFPTNILAGMFGFQQKQFFEAGCRRSRTSSGEVLDMLPQRSCHRNPSSKPAPGSPLCPSVRLCEVKAFRELLLRRAPIYSNLGLGPRPSPQLARRRFQGHHLHRRRMARPWSAKKSHSLSSASGTAFTAPFRSSIPDPRAPTTRSFSMS